MSLFEKFFGSKKSPYSAGQQKPQQTAGQPANNQPVNNQPANNQQVNNPQTPTQQGFSVSFSTGKNLPAFLVKPNDPISNKMYGASLTKIIHQKCGYQIEINEKYHDRVPDVRKGSDKFEIDETHVFSKNGVDSWVAIKTMKTPMVNTTPLENFVKTGYVMSKNFNMPELMTALPSFMTFDGYESIGVAFLGQWEEFNKEKGLEQSLVFCHVFKLKTGVFKDYILCAKKGIYAWKLECYIHSVNDNPKITGFDFVPPGFLFGGFFPAV